MSLKSFDSSLRDMYSMPGERIKQWVVEMRREHEWEAATCPRVDVPDHMDNTDIDCGNVGRTPWINLDHDCCDLCNDLYSATANRSDIVEWLELKSKRTPITSDRNALSDEVASELRLADHPFFQMIKGRK